MFNFKQRKEWDHQARLVGLDLEYSVDSTSQPSDCMHYVKKTGGKVVLQ